MRKIILLLVFMAGCFGLGGCGILKPDCLEALNESAYMYPVYDRNGSEIDCPAITFEKFDIVRSDENGKRYYAEGTAYGKDQYCDYTIGATINFRKYDQGWDVESIEFGQLQQEVQDGMSEQGLLNWLNSSIDSYIPELDDWKYLGTWLEDQNGDGVKEQIVELAVSRKDNVSYVVSDMQIVLSYTIAPGHWKFGDYDDYVLSGEQGELSYLLVEGNTYTDPRGENCFQVVSVPEAGIGEIKLKVLNTYLSEWSVGETYTLVWQGQSKMRYEDQGNPIFTAKNKAAGYLEYVWEDDPSIGIGFALYPYDGMESIQMYNTNICYLYGQTEEEIAQAAEDYAEYKVNTNSVSGWLAMYSDQQEENLEYYDDGAGIQESGGLSDEEIEEAMQAVNHINDYAEGMRGGSLEEPADASPNIIIIGEDDDPLSEEKENEDLPVESPVQELPFPSVGEDVPVQQPPVLDIRADQTLFYNGHQYMLLDINDFATKSYDDMEAICEEKGGHLAVIDSEEENQTLYRFVQEEGYTMAFFGYSDERQEGNWLWVGNREGAYTNWGEGQPNNGANNKNETAENYAHFAKDGGGTWNDAPFGSNTCMVICEWDYE